MACPFFTTIKVMTALIILIFSFMQVMALKRRGYFLNRKENEDQIDETNDDSQEKRIVPQTADECVNSGATN